MTITWGVLALCFAMVASLADNLIEFVNIIGSLFYGTILGVFLVAFFMKKIKGWPVFLAAVASEALVIGIYLTGSRPVRSGTCQVGVNPPFVRFGLC
jgi:SSS family solute:Na+ symporter